MDETLIRLPPLSAAELPAAGIEATPAAQPEAAAVRHPGELPDAPLAMPLQALEHAEPLHARLRPLWRGWLRAHALDL